jgi:outer membrane lipoprotein-sorting protein
MKRIGTLFIGAIFFLAASVPSASAADRLDEILANMQREGGKIRSFYAEMSQQTLRVDLGGRPETYKAAVYFKQGKGDKALLSYSKPAGQKIWVVGNDIYLYQAGLKQVIKTNRSRQASKNPEVSFVASPYKSVPQLKSQYAIVYLGDEGGLAKLELTPKARSSVSKAILWVNQSLWIPVKYEVTATNGNISTITLSNVGVNGSIRDSDFKPTWPGDTKVINQ